MVDYSVIPLMAILVSAAFGAVSISWDSERRATRSMGVLFGAITLWALVDLLTYMETDPVRALAWMRWTHVGPLLVGPAVLWTVAQMLPTSRGRLERQARVATAICLFAGVGVGFLPGVIEEMIPTWYGWMPRYGPVSIGLIPLGLVLPIYAAVQAARIESRSGDVESERKRVAGLRIGVALSIGIAMPTEFLAPLLEVPVPRLGALGVAIAAAIVWLAVLHETEDLMLTPRGVARRILAELGDGVALVDPEGRILSTNARFAEMAGRSESDVLGQRLSILFDAPLERILAGVEDRESSLCRADGHSYPVSLSSSAARNRSGRAIGVVVAVRDRREIDDLRRQLLSSGRLAAIGELAAGIAHEVNNPVAFIRSDLNLLGSRAEEIRRAVSGSTIGLDQLGVFDRMDERLRRANAQLDQVAQVVVDVREFAHVGGAGQGGSDPEAVVEGAMRLARMQRDGDVEMRVASVVGGDRCDSGQELKQILLVLLRDLAAGADKGAAIEAELRTDGRELALALDVSPLTVPAASLRSRLESLGSAVARIEEPRSFEAAEEHDAAALGLSSVGELLEQLGGRLSVDSVTEASLRLELAIPLVAQPDPEAGR